MFTDIRVQVTYDRPQTKLWEANVFTPVCQSFCSQGAGGLCMITLPVWLPGPMIWTLGGFCLFPRSFQGDLCLWFYVPSRGSLSRGLSPWQRPPRQRDPLPPDRDPPSPRTETPLLPGQRPPCMVKSGRYASYLNAFLLMEGLKIEHNYAS